MRRTQIYLDENQDQALGTRARSAGQTKSALIREAIDAYLAPGDDGHARIERLRAAVGDALGAAPNLPPGPAYVESLRAADQERERLLER